MAAARTLSLGQSLIFPVEVGSCVGGAGLEGSGRRSAAGKGASTAAASSSASVPHELLQAFQGLPLDAFGLRLLEEVRQAKRRGQAGSAAALAAALQQRGYSASVQRQAASSFGAAGVVQLRHEFVAVRAAGGREPLIVEPSFVELFAIATPTVRYQALLDVVPDVVVAEYGVLASLVRLLCAEMKFSFEARGNALPPWRSFKSAMSRWSVAAAAQAPQRPTVL